MNPDPVAAGVVLAGTDPVAVDLVCAVLMGFDPDRLPIVRGAFQSRGWPLTYVDRERINVLSDRASWNAPVMELNSESLFQFRPHFGWQGYLEAGWRTR